MKIHVVYNPAAAGGRAGSRLGAALAVLNQRGVDVTLHRPGSAGVAHEALEGLAGEVERVVVVGGDGMVHLAANALAGSSTVLGIITAGTGNDAAAAFGLPRAIETACAAAMADPQAIDLLDTDGGLGVTVATAGFSVAVNERADAMRRLRGAMKYTVATVAELPRMKPHQIELSLDGTVHPIEANLVAVANTAYFGGGMKIAPDADPTDGLLDVIVIGPASRAAFAALLPTVFSGRHVKSRYVKTHRARVVKLDGANLGLRADGEPLGRVPTTISVRPQSLLVAGYSA